MPTSDALSLIMKAVHEAASDLHRLGLIDRGRMRNYDLMCLEPGSGDDALNGVNAAKGLRHCRV